MCTLVSGWENWKKRKSTKIELHSLDRSTLGFWLMLISPFWCEIVSANSDQVWQVLLLAQRGCWCAPSSEFRYFWVQVALEKGFAFRSSAFRDSAIFLEDYFCVQGFRDSGFSVHGFRIQRSGIQGFRIQRSGIQDSAFRDSGIQRSVFLDAFRSSAFRFF